MPDVLLKRWTDFSAGIGYLVDDGQTPGMYTALAILGSEQGLRPAPLKNDVDASGSFPANNVVYYFFEESKATNNAYLYMVSANTANTTRLVVKFDLRNATFGALVGTSVNTANNTALGQPARYQGKWYLGLPGATCNELTLVATASTSGDGANMTSDNTHLTDTDEAWATDEWVAGVVTCEGKTMTVTGNTATALTGAAWSGGGNPGNAKAWTMIGNDGWTAGAATTGAHQLVTTNFQLVGATSGTSGNRGVRVLDEDGDPGTAADWGPYFPAGDITERAAALGTLGDLIFLLNPVGLYSFNKSGRSAGVFEQFQGWRSPLRVSQTPTWYGGLVVTHPGGLMYYRPGFPPVRIDPGAKGSGRLLPPIGPTELHGGRYQGVAVIGDTMYVLQQPDATSAAALLLAGTLINADDPTNLAWQSIASITLARPELFNGVGASTAGYPVSATIPTPTVWVGDITSGAGHVSYVTLDSAGSPFRSRADTHKVVLAGDAYLSELFFLEPIDLTRVVVRTSEDRAVGDEWKISILADGTGRDENVTYIKGSGAYHERPIDRHSVTRLMLHVNWVATSTTARVPPTITAIELYGNPARAGES